MPPKAKSKTADASCCPLTSEPRLRLASDAQTATITDRFSKGIAKPALCALFAAGYTRLEQLAKVTEEELPGFHGMGPKAVRILREALRSHGLDFRK